MKSVVKWRPDTREQLQATAVELFAQRGLDGVTVGEIAAEAGLAERTFFRYFTDKREVLFSGPEDFARLLTDPVDEATTHEPMALVRLALEGVTAFLSEDRRAFSAARAAVIASDPRLVERELLKMNALADELAEAIGRHGIDPTTATMAAGAGVTVFRVAYVDWVLPGEHRSLSELLDESMRRWSSLFEPPRPS